MKKVFLASLFVMLPMSVLAQAELSPAKRAGICYAALSRQSPQPAGEAQRRSEYTKNDALFGKFFLQCTQQGVNPANSNAFKSCLFSKGITNSTYDYITGYIEAVEFIKSNRTSNSDIGAMAVSYCTF